MAAPRSADEFVELLRRSGLVAEESLSAYLAGLHATGVGFDNPAKLAGLMVRDHILTGFQAEQLVQGHWRGFTFGVYTLLESLASGSTTNVFLCEDLRLRRRVAVKILLTARATDPIALARFQRGTRILASLEHPNIVSLFEVSQHENLFYVVMEHIDGSSLREITRRRHTLPALRAAHYVRQAAEGLQHAHERGHIVHRDIKPGHILVDRCGSVKIIDMGLAHVASQDRTVRAANPDSTVIGTAEFMAPEQARDFDDVDIRADIYSLGATFYFCVTGHKPFRGGTVADKLLRLQTQSPEPIAHWRVDVPPTLAALIERMMAKDPAARPQTPQEVVDALAPFTALPIDPPPADEMPPPRIQ
jgi:serine/threonine protein kinase